MTYPADNVLVVGEMGFASLAAIYLAAVEIGVVGKTHGDDAHREFLAGKWLQDSNTGRCSYTGSHCPRSVGLWKTTGSS